MAFRDPIEKRSSASLFQDQDRSARVQADAGSEPRDPFWWLAVLATRAAFAARPGAKLVSIPLNGGSLRVSVGGGWRASTSLPDDVAAQLDLYLPYCFSRPGGLAVAHIGQSLDGRIATENGESRWITGEADRLHCHRMRAIADAVLVGAHTVRADNPQLTVRRCAGDNPLRVIIDPELSLTGRYKIFREHAAATLVVAAKEHGDRRMGAKSLAFRASASHSMFRRSAPRWLTGACLLCSSRAVGSRSRAFSRQAASTVCR